MSLVAPPRCTYPVPCNVCWYCHVATDGPEWWLKVKPKALVFDEWLARLEAQHAGKRPRKR